MADKFFQEDQQVEEQPQENQPQSIKIGEKEYTQDELSRLVGLGEIALEAEDKYKTKIDRVWPEYTKATQRLSEYEKRLQEAEAKLNQPQPPLQNGQNTQYTPEQIRAEAIRQAEELGIGPNAMRNIIREELAADKLIGDINGLISEAQDSGQPVTTPENLLNFMSESGIRNPQQAYKLMFEDELDKIKEQKLASLKPTGMVTTGNSQAGGKQPQPVRITKSNLQALVAEALSAGGNG